MNKTRNFSEYYKNRFSSQEEKNKNLMWKVLCKFYLQKFVRNSDTVLDLGAGYCEFINNIECKKKIAVDINPDVKKYANKNVKIINKGVFDISKKMNNSVDVVFVSNFLEHLNTKDEVVDILNRVNKLLKSGGKIILLQPNIDLVKESYWDFIDHKVALNTKSIKEALEISNFKIVLFIKRFLPYTTKNRRIPMLIFLLKIYISLPSFLRLLAGQTFVVAVKK